MNNNTEILSQADLHHFTFQELNALTLFVECLQKSEPIDQVVVQLVAECPGLEKALPRRANTFPLALVRHMVESCPWMLDKLLIEIQSEIEEVRVHGRQKNSPNEVDHLAPDKTDLRSKCLKNLSCIIQSQDQLLIYQQNLGGVRLKRYSMLASFLGIDEQHKPKKIAEVARDNGLSYRKCYKEIHKANQDLLLYIRTSNLQKKGTAAERQRKYLPRSIRNK